MAPSTSLQTQFLFWHDGILSALLTASCSLLTALPTHPAAYSLVRLLCAFSVLDTEQQALALWWPDQRVVG